MLQFGVHRKELFIWMLSFKFLGIIMWKKSIMVKPQSIGETARYEEGPRSVGEGTEDRLIGAVKVL